MDAAAALAAAAPAHVLSSERREHRDSAEEHE